MRSRQRKLIGTIFMLLFVVVYALIAMVVAQATAMRVEVRFLADDHIRFARPRLGDPDHPADRLDGKAGRLKRRRALWLAGPW